MKHKVDIENICARLYTRWGDVSTELHYSNNFTLLIAVVLSAQATDTGVNKATEKLFQVVSTPEDIISIGLDELKNYIKSIGLYNNKAQNVIKLSQALIDNHNSQVPDNFNDLVSLPGVGRKTANVVLNVVFNCPTIAVDTHVFRVSQRLKLSEHSDIVKLEEDLVNKIPKQYIYNIHNLLIMHGRYVCKAKKPNCKECYLYDLCASFPL